MILQGETVGLPDAYKIISARPVPDFIGEIPGLGLNGVATVAGLLVVLLFITTTLWNRKVKKAKGYEVLDSSLLALKPFRPIRSSHCSPPSGSFSVLPPSSA